MLSSFCVLCCTSLKMCKHRRKYTPAEDKALLAFVPETCHIYHTQGHSLWKLAEKLKITKHSWQSTRARCALLALQPAYKRAKTTSHGTSFRSTKRKFCEQCQAFVSARTYRQHLDLYYNKESVQWNIREESSDEERSDPVDLDVCAEEVYQLNDDCIQRPVVMASCYGGSISEPGISLYI